MKTKVCSKCNQEKLLSECVKGWRKKYGKYYYGHCNECMKGYNTNIKRKHRKNNPEKYKARSIISQMIQEKKLEKELCAICGKVKVEAHHDDYSKPLEVSWLCRKHHLKKHGYLERNSLTS